MRKKQQGKLRWGVMAPAITFCFIVLLLIILNPFQIPSQEEKNPETDTPIHALPTNAMQSLPSNPITFEADLTATPEAGPPATIVWMSDTQGYSRSYPEIFESMTNWIVDQQDALNIQYVLHTGDVVDNFDDMRQWENAKKALSVLEGKVPLFVVAGNHDIHGTNQEYGAYLELFGEKRFETLPTFGGAYRSGRGRYDLVSIEDVPVIFMSTGYGMGYGVDDDAITWINEILQQYSDRFAILCFHSYIDPDESFSTDGGVLFEKVVKKNPNVGLVLCGHRHGVNHTAVQLDDNGDGTPDRTVYQMVADYQDESKSGGGYLGLLTFNRTERTISVNTYSPYLDDYICNDGKKELEEFTLPWDYK
ncbi:MAG: metallophosphoesterase [Eubacteriales bacterium]|nr:metallophosphoesterase [Eubacteriales bacterium]